MPRSTLLRVAGFAIAVGGVVVALTWTHTCTAIVQSDCPPSSRTRACIGASRVCHTDSLLRIAIATGAIAVALALAAWAARDDARRL